jgi:hypothetical protein
MFPAGVVWTEGKRQNRHSLTALDPWNLPQKCWTFGLSGNHARRAWWSASDCIEGAVNLRQAQETKGVLEDKPSPCAIGETETELVCIEEETQIRLPQQRVRRPHCLVWGGRKGKNAHEAWKRPSNCQSGQSADQSQLDCWGKQRLRHYVPCTESNLSHQIR